MSKRLIVMTAIGLAACREASQPESSAETAFVVPHDATIPDDSLGRPGARLTALAASDTDRD